MWWVEAFSAAALPRRLSTVANMRSCLEAFPPRFSKKDEDDSSPHTQIMYIRVHMYDINNNQEGGWTVGRVMGLVCAM